MTAGGAAPATSPALYTGPVTINASLTFTTAASKVGYSYSQPVSVVYTINPVVQVPVTTPVFAPPGGTYSATQSVTISDSTASAIIYYTTYGTVPSSSSTVYSGVIRVGVTETLKAIASAPGFLTSATATASYIIPVQPPTINFGPGFASASALVEFNGSAVISGSKAQLTGAASGEASTIWNMALVTIGKFTTDFTFQQTDATGDGMTFSIQNSRKGIHAKGGNGGSLGYGGIDKSIAVKFDLYNNSGEGSDSTGIYWNGAVPTIPSTDLSSTGIDLHSGHVFAAHITYDGTTITLKLTDQTNLATYTTSWPVDIPTVVGGSTGYVGFTSSTGSRTAIQDVLAWTFLSQ